MKGLRFKTIPAPAAWAKEAGPGTRRPTALRHSTAGKKRSFIDVALDERSKLCSKEPFQTAWRESQKKRNIKKPCLPPAT